MFCCLGNKNVSYCYNMRISSLIKTYSFKQKSKPVMKFKLHWPSISSLTALLIIRKQSNLTHRRVDWMRAQCWISWPCYFILSSGIVSVISQLLTEHANYREQRWSRGDAAHRPRTYEKFTPTTITRLLEMGSDFSLFTWFSFSCLLLIWIVTLFHYITLYSKHLQNSKPWLTRHHDK